MLTGPVPPPPPAPALPPGLVGAAPARAPKRGRRRSRRPLVIVVVVAVVVALVAVAAVVLLKASGIKTGSGTATITWTTPAHAVGPASKSLSGTVDGLTLIAKSTGVAPAVGGTVPGTTGGGTLPVAHWSGTLGGKTFDLDVTESIVSGSPSATSNKYLGSFNIVYRVTGTYGTDAVKGTATADPHHAGRLQFSGTVGSFHIKGTASEPKKSATEGKFRASFVVTG